MARSTWLPVAIALAVLVPWEQAHAVRIERRGSAATSSASSAPARTGRVARWRDTTRSARPPVVTGRVARSPVGARTAARPLGIVHGPEGTARVARGDQAAGNERVGVQIDRTRRMLELVRDRAERCGSPEARGGVRRALELQDRAESAERAGRHLGALQLTRGAREQGFAALRHCGHTGRSPEGVVSALGRTDELLRVERERLSDLPSVSPGRRGGAIERATAAQRHAQAEFRDGRLESSLRFTHEARQSLRAGAGREAGSWRDAARGAETRREAARKNAAPRPRLRRD